MGIFDFLKSKNTEQTIGNADSNKINCTIYTPENIDSLQPNEVFVFGSNLGGHHGGGAARVALNKFGAIYGQGVGLQGQSYAIPTMQGGVETIQPYVDDFIKFAENNQQLFFFVTRIGCGIGGFRDEQIAPLFSNALVLTNVSLPESFVRILNTPHIPNSFKIEEYGRVRTLTDIIKALFEQNHYQTIEALFNDFHHVLERYKKRGTIPEETFNIIKHILKDHDLILFNKGRLNLEYLEKLLYDRKYIDDIIESVYYKRNLAKTLKLIQYLNDFRRYTSSDHIINDLIEIASSNKLLEDDFHFPLYFFERGLETLWPRIIKNNIMSNELLEKYMFTLHNEKLNSFGIEEIIKNYYVADSCHKNIFYPRELGTGPIYEKLKNGSLVKVCGSGIFSIPDWYEYNLTKHLIRRDPKYFYSDDDRFDEEIFPICDDTLPVYSSRGKFYFKDESEKKELLKMLRNLR